MQSLRVAAVFVILAATALAGCTSGPGQSAPGTNDGGQVIVTRPGDYSADFNATNASLPHFHDYWGGKTRLVVMDGWPTNPGPGVAAGSAVPIYDYRPESGHVVPQGASEVDVTMTWTAALDDIYQDPQLWVKTAADTTPAFVAHIQSGQKVTVNSTNDKDDLPHQLLSAWTFQLRLSQRDDVGMLRFKANVTLHAEAVRGLSIPLYPGHPDRWGGVGNITLVDVTRDLAYLQDQGDAGCDGISCPQVEVPRNGTIVPPGAAYVEATIEVKYGNPQTVGFSYHGAEGRAFQRMQPTATNGNVRTYRIEVNGFGDGPYAKTSQWEFAPFVSGPAPDTAVVETYHLVIVAHHHLV